MGFQEHISRQMYEVMYEVSKTKTPKTKTEDRRRQDEDANTWIPLSCQRLCLNFRN